MTLTSLVWGNTATAFIFSSLPFLCRIHTCCKSESLSTHAKHKPTVLYWPGERIDSPSTYELQLSFGMRSSNRILFACARRFGQDDRSFLLARYDRIPQFNRVSLVPLFIGVKVLAVCR